MNVYLVFYTRPEQEDELFLPPVHLTEAGAKKAAEADARDQGHTIRRPRNVKPGTVPAGWRWGLGPDGPKNPAICGDGKEKANILTDWHDMDDSGKYEVVAVPLVGADHIIHEIQHQCLRLLGEA